MEPGRISIIPPVLAVALALVTREAATSLALACFAGVLLMGQGPRGFPGLVTARMDTPVVLVGAVAGWRKARYDPVIAQESTLDRRCPKADRAK